VGVARPFALKQELHLGRRWRGRQPAASHYTARNQQG
jgi:hypothetical protein